MDVIDFIRARQAGMPEPESDIPPEHKPQFLLIGCVDARLSIHKDIGFPDGSTLIYRNIAALIGGKHPAEGVERISEAAALEFAVDVMKVKHIAVMGHTDCGGIKACLNGAHDEHTQSIRKYLTPLNETREAVVAHGGNIEAQARAMEEAAVRQSVANLMTYPAVAKAVAEGRLVVHGWVMNTGSGRLSEMNPDTGKFTPMKNNMHRSRASGEPGTQARTIP